MISGPNPNRVSALLQELESGEMGPSQFEHLLKVAASVAKDASGVWAEIWGEFKPHVTPGGMVMPQLENGFVPACGWSEFLEKLWLLKHYLDSIDRLCRQR